MKLLSLSTAEQGCSLALFDDGKLMGDAYWDDRTTHSKRLVPMIEETVIQRAGFALEDLDAYVAAKGPGSFTGLRIGISMVQGLAYAMDKPCGGISSLDGIAWRFSHVSHTPVCVMMDARRGEVYTAVYRFKGGCLVEKSVEQVCAPGRILDQIPREPALFVGSGSKAYAGQIKALSGGDADFSHPCQDAVSAAAMGRIVLETDQFFEKKENALLPTYIRKSDAEIQFAEKTSILTS